MKDLKAAIERLDAKRKSWNPPRQFPPPWISVEDALPKIGRYVLIHLNIDNWEDRGDQVGVYFKVAARRTAQKEGNNERKFAWDEFGPSEHFGQEVDYWMEIPRP